MITVNPIQKLVVWVPVGGCEEMISYLFEARAELTRTAAWRQCWLSALGRVVYTMVYFFVSIYIYIYTYIYIYMYRDSVVKSPQWEPSIPQQLNTNVIRGACETCTTSCKRGQLLWIRWQVLKHCKGLLIRLYIHINKSHTYIYIYTYYTKHLKHEVRSYFILQGI